MGLISKVLYLKETKDLIEDGLYNVGANITEYDTFRSYPDIVDDLYNSWPRVTASGESATLDQTMEAPLTIDLKGNTTQNGTPTPSSPVDVNVVSGDNEVVVCGKNLFNGTNPTYVNSKILNNSGVEINDTSGGYTKMYINVEPSTEYTISGLTSTGSKRIYYFDINKTFISRTDTFGTSYKTFTTPSNCYYVDFQYYLTGNDFSTYMLCKGTSTTYEPYTSQNYPLYLGVENLLNPVGTSQTSTGITFTNNGDGTFTVNGTATDNVAIPLTNLTTYPITLNPNETYTQTLYILSGDFGLANKVSVVPAFKNGGGTITYNYFKCTKDDLTSTKTPTETMYAYTYNLYIGSGAVITNCTFRVQLEKGKSNSYSPYGTTPIELNKIGNYQDYIYKDSGKWYLHKEVGKSVFTGASSESWTRELPGNNIVNHYIKINEAVNNANSPIYNNMALYNSTISGNDNNHKCYISGSNNLNFRADEIATTNDLRTLLGTTNMVVYYILKTTADIEITNSSLINQLEDLRGAMSYKGQTNISQVNNDLPFILSVEALKGSAE